MSEPFERQTWRGKTYLMVPEPPRERDISPCASCIFNDRGCYGINCSGGRIAIEDTPEALAKYIAARMTK